jgi:hypothetical protein
MSIAKAFSSSSMIDAGIQLEAFEVGNEPDLYSKRGERPSTYAVQYVPECVLTFRSRFQLGVSLPTRCPFARWDQFAGMIALTQQSVKFWGASFAQSSHSTSGFSPQAIFEEGITLSLPGSVISTYVCFLTQTRAFMLIDSFVA